MYNVFIVVLFQARDKVPPHSVSDVYVKKLEKSYLKAAIYFKV